MRADAMKWVGRAVAVVFGAGILALVAAIVVMIRQSEGVPPMPIFLGIAGLTMLVLLAGACLALISLAVSARQIARALPAGAALVEPLPEPAPEQAPVVEEPERQGPPFTPTGLAQVAERRPVRPGRVLVAER